MKPQELESQEMLSEAGYSSTGELLAAMGAVDAGAWTPSLDPLPEHALRRRLQQFAAGVTPAARQVSFLGAGAADHYLPASVGAVGGFPADDAEIDRLGSRYARLIEELTGLPAALPQVLTFVEALGCVARSIRQNRPTRRTVCLAGTLPPLLSARLQGIFARNGLVCRLIPFENGLMSLPALRELDPDDLAAIIVASPNFLGSIEPMSEIGHLAREMGALFIAAVSPLSLSLLASPGEYQADLCFGDLHPLGLSDRTTGEYYFLAIDDPTASWFPARDGAASLRRIAAFFDRVGGRGLRQYAQAAFKNAHFLQAAICQIAGFQPAHSAAFFSEFVVRTPVSASDLVSELEEQGIVAGLALSRVGGQDDLLLVSATEVRTRAEVDYFLRALKQFRDRSSGRGLGIDF